MLTSLHQKAIYETFYRISCTVNNYICISNRPGLKGERHNGHIFRTDGTVVLNTGVAVELKDGEQMDMNGNKITNKSYNKAGNAQKATKQ